MSIQTIIGVFFYSFLENKAYLLAAFSLSMALSMLMKQEISSRKGLNGKAPNGKLSSGKLALQTGYNFGTFKGVFTPSILTILGVVMYLRFGWVLGQVGLWCSLLIVVIATAITFLTGLALSSLATNMKVGGGGAYYLISRSLGVEVGAAVGLPLFFAQALGISFYIVGFAESVEAFFQASPQVIGLVTLVVITVVAYLSANLALKLQFFIMAAIIFSLISFFLGTPPQASAVLTEGIVKEPFWIVFAVFFPAVTGIEAGIAMSGDLKDPSRSLPWGTLGAIAVGFVIYTLIFLFLNASVKDSSLLISNRLIMQDVARWGWAILIGVWGASLSSAMGALLGAPRTLQALALDRVIPSFLGKSYGENRDPRVATGIVFVIGALGIILGDLNLIAPVLSMFFLTSYGCLNLSAGFEGLISSPSWRPKFKVSWRINFLGALMCFFAMFMINPGATFIAAGVTGSVFYLMKKRSMIAHWGDLQQGVLMFFVRFGIERLSALTPHIRTWKPNILVLSGAPTSRWYLIELAHAISHERSMMTVASVLSNGDVGQERIKSVTESIRTYLKKREVNALVKVMPARDTLLGLEALIRAYGFGPIVPDTILLGESEKEEKLAGYVSLIDLILRMKKNLVIVREGNGSANLKDSPRIDLWWGRKSENVGLMLALAFQLKKHKDWNDAKLVIKTLVGKTQFSSEEQAEKRMETFIERERLNAEIEVVESSGKDAFLDMRESSKGASLVFLGIRSPREDESADSFSSYYRDLLGKTRDFPPTALVYAAQDLDFYRIFSS